MQAGRLLGAQTFIFGQYMILSKNKVRIDARVVHTATGEIILTKQVTGDFGGDPEKFLELEKELVVALAQGIEKVAKAMNQTMTLEQLTKGYFDEKSKAIDKREAYVEVQFLTAEALELEDAGKFEKAQKIWQKIREADPNNEVAQVRPRGVGQFCHELRNHNAPLYCRTPGRGFYRRSHELRNLQSATRSLPMSYEGSFPNSKPKSRPTREIRRSLEQLGIAYFALGDRDKAIEPLQKALEIETARSYDGGPGPGENLRGNRRCLSRSGHLPKYVPKDKRRATAH